METYKCEVCGFISAVPGVHCGKPLVKQEEPAPIPATEAPAPTPTAENPSQNNQPPQGQ